MWPWGHKAVLSFPSGQAGAEFIATEKKGTHICDPDSALEVVSSRRITVLESTLIMKVLTHLHFSVFVL